MHRNRRPADEGRGRDDPGRCGGGERDRLQRIQDRPEHRGDHGPRRPMPVGDDAAEHRADPVRDQDGRPRARAVEIVLRDHRPEHVPEHEEDVPHAEQDDGRPQPGAQRELAPALAKPWKKRAAVSTTRGAIAIRTSNNAATTNDTASMSSAIPGLPATTIAPPSAGPITQSRFLVRPRSAFACCSRSALTVCGTSPISAGRRSRRSCHRRPGTRQGARPTHGPRARSRQ